jgi:RimJ/RimL family protein N-acetyltransferase
MSDINMFTFRNIEQRDEAVVLRLKNNPSNVKFFKNPNPVSAEDHAKWFASRLNEFIELQIVGELAGQLIGIVFLVPQDNVSSTISINVDSEFQSQGIGRELLKRMLSRADALEFSRIEALIHTSNIKSVSLFEKSGFVFEEKVSELFNRYVRLANQKTSK